MLAVIREFAADRLRAAGQTDEAAARHAQFYVGLAEEPQTHLRGANQGDWLDRSRR